MKKHWEVLVILKIQNQKGGDQWDQRSVFSGTCGCALAAQAQSSITHCLYSGLIHPVFQAQLTSFKRAHFYLYMHFNVIYFGDTEFKFFLYLVNKVMTYLTEHTLFKSILNNDIVQKYVGVLQKLFLCGKYSGTVFLFVKLKKKLPQVKTAQNKIKKFLFVFINDIVFLQQSNDS